MPKTSAGLVMYRQRNGAIEVFDPRLERLRAALERRRQQIHDGLVFVSAVLYHERRHGGRWAR